MGSGAVQNLPQTLGGGGAPPEQQILPVPQPEVVQQHLSRVPSFLRHRLFVGQLGLVQDGQALSRPAAWHLPAKQARLEGQSQSSLQDELALQTPIEPSLLRQGSPALQLELVHAKQRDIRRNAAHLLVLLLQTSPNFWQSQSCLQAVPIPPAWHVPIEPSLLKQGSPVLHEPPVQETHMLARFRG